MNSTPPTDQKQLFIRVVKFSTAFSLGCMAAFLHSLRDVNPALRFEVSWLTAVWFLAGAGFSQWFWKLLPLETGGHDDVGASREGKLLRAVLLTVVMTGGVAAAFVYALKDVPREQLPEFAIGTTLAVVFLSAAGGLLFVIGRYFDSDR